MSLSPNDASGSAPKRGLDSLVRSNIVWAGLGIAAFTAAVAFAYRPNFDSTESVVLAVVPWLLIAGMAIAVSDLSTLVRVAALIVVMAAWAVLIFDKAEWSLLSFAVYLLCFTFDTERRSIGVALAGLATAIWTAAWALSENPQWTVMLPGIAFVAGSALFLALDRTSRIAREQAILIDELHATREELAESERSRGTLEERERLTGEIHDTLAQGFTSIVLIARGASRLERPTEALSSIETAAEEYLAEARRIVASTQPHELDGSSLHEALERTVATSFSAGVDAEFRVVGQTLRLTADIEVTLLRGTQEALRNIRTHANATEVEVTLSYLDDAVALDVRDNGAGFVSGQVSDRGSLTGGQGLEILARRAESLSGELTIESSDPQGSVVSLLLPVGVG